MLLIGLRHLRELRRRLGPTREGEFADKFNTMPKYVVSSTLKDPEWNNTYGSRRRGRRGEEPQAGARRDIYVPGSLRLAQELLENDLVDEIHLMVFPVVLGTGAACSAR